ncbi:sensor histidine kinase [Paenibacillus haidiansis]|uniref:sensor histidine kinase n=1 Tax=Paenibacillus haidiansis TaxID=1574488 RepID=UPI002F953FA0
MPILILSVVMTGLFSYLSVVRQLQKTSYYNLSDTVQQTTLFLNDKMLTIFEQLVAIENDNSFRHIFSNEGQEKDQNRYTDIIGLHDRFEEIYHGNFQMIDSIYVGFSNGRSFNLQKEFVPRKVGADLNDWLSRYDQSDKGYYWLNSHRDQVFDTVEPRQVLSSFKMIGSTTSPVSGLILINLREDYLLNIMENMKISPNGTLALISSDGTLFSKTMAPEYEVTPETLEQLAGMSGDRGSLTVTSARGEKLKVAYDTLPLNKWVLAAIVPEKDILESVNTIKYVSLLIILIVLLIFVIVAAVVARTLTNPIRYLSKQVKRFERGDFNVNFQLDERNEIGVLGNGLARLSESVQMLLEEVRQKQEQKRLIELQALQAQIQPHFLYNTLCSIKHLIDLEEKEKASGMVDALTHFFRIGLSKGRELITIREEIEHIRSYLLILNIRYSGDFEYEIKIPEELLALTIPKLTLQPIVENAIYHGIKGRRGPGFLSVTGFREGSKAILEVLDNGPGMEEGDIRKLERSIYADKIDDKPITYGLRNCHQRISLHFGTDYGLSIKSESGAFTCVRVEIPYDRERSGQHAEIADCGR